MTAGVLQERQRALDEYKLISMSPGAIPTPEPQLGVMRQTAPVAEPAGLAHSGEEGVMLCDRCLQPIDMDAFQANVDRLQVSSGDCRDPNNNSHVAIYSRQCELSKRWSLGLSHYA